MQNVPKIVRDRLKATTPAVNHPDADVLTAFGERALPELERAVVVEHLARCGDCRDIVALALPAMEPVQIALRPSPSGWLTWPALRWGVVAAGVVAIAWFGILYQRRSQPAMMAYKTSAPPVEATEAKNQSLPIPAAPAPAVQAPAVRTNEERRDKITAPAAPAFADSLDATRAAENGGKGVFHGEASAARVAPPPAGAVIGGNAGASFGGPLPHGPRVANQWQQQNNALNQAPRPAPPSAYAKQQHSDADMAANGQISATTQTSAVSPTIAAQNAEVAQVRDQGAAPSASSARDASPPIDRAKALVPSASRAEVATNNQPGQNPVFGKRTSQAAPGQLRGYVFDPAGAVVPNARITITPANAGGTATSVTNSQGLWQVAGLPTGTYKAQAEAPGFQTSLLELNYDAAQPSMYNFRLSVGTASEMVEVSAQNAQVQTSQIQAGQGQTGQGQTGQAQTVGATVAGPDTNREVSEFAIRGRNVTQLSAVPSALQPRWTISAAGGLQRSFDQGQTWQAVDVANSASYGATSLEVVAKTSRAKKVKEKDNQNDADKTRKLSAATLTFRAVAATGADVWAGGSAGALYHSVDAGNRWTRIVPASAGATLTGDVISLEFPDPQHGTVSTSTSEIWTTSDDGQTWQKQ